MCALAVLLAAVVFVVPATAHADSEAWFWFEYRQRLGPLTPKGVPKLGWRVITDARLNTRSDGLHLGFFRTGPILELTSNLVFAANGVALAERTADGRFQAEYRAELEPTFQGRLGWLGFTDRNRLEVRLRNAEVRLRYRNMLRVNLVVPGVWVQPFVWDEILIDLAGLGLNQNRFTTGVAVMLMGNVRVDVGAMFRSRLVPQSGWVHDGIFNTMLFVGMP